MTVELAVNVILIALGILVLPPIAAFCLECLAAMLTPRKEPTCAIPGGQTFLSACKGQARMPVLLTQRDELVISQTAEPRTVVLIPAHNEQSLIEQTVLSVRFSEPMCWGGSCTAAPAGDGATVAPTRVLVVADNCDDRTAELARRAGAEVVERNDPQRRGKGYALACGLAALRVDPPEVVVVVDADCLAAPGAVGTLARLAWYTQRPVQALNLTDREPAAGPVQSVALLGNRFANLVRPLGLTRLGLPCRLTGTGMAIPWPLAERVELGGSIVEDMQLGIDLSLLGHFPLFCPEARVASSMPAGDGAFLSQRTRWDHGHLRTAAVQTPRLLAASLARRSWPLLGLALDLGIPPLTLLVALWLGAAILAGAAWRFGASWLPLALLAGGGAALAVALGLGWLVFCRRQVPLRTFFAAPKYMLRKLPIYARLLFHRQHVWVRTERDSR